MNSWKSTVHDYIQGTNQARVEQSIHALHGILNDQAYARLAADHTDRLDEYNSYRGIKPVKNETRARLLDAGSDPFGVRLRLVLHSKFTYEQRSHPFVEERIDQQWLQLQQTINGWQVVNIAPVILERKAELYPLAEPVPADDESKARHTSQGNRIPQPFLNNKLLASARVPRIAKYNRKQVQIYADKWWDSFNPDYAAFGVDCTNYVSQCVFAGGLPMNYTGKRNAGWWYQGLKGGEELWSYSWAVSNSLQAYLGSSRSGIAAEAVESPQELMIGDIIVYDWDGDGRYQHSTIVAALDAEGMPLVNAHTTTSKHRFWDYRDSYAWTQQTKYRFFHILN